MPRAKQRLFWDCGAGLQSRSLERVRLVGSSLRQVFDLTVPGRAPRLAAITVQQSGGQVSQQARVCAPDQAPLWIIACNHAGSSAAGR